jgi:hypothetical protein
MASYAPAREIAPHKLRSVFLWKFKPHELRYASTCPFLDVSEKGRPCALEGLEAAQIGETVESIDVTGTLPDQLIGPFLPTIARFFEIVSPDNILMMVEFLTDRYGISVVFMAFLYFNPLNISESFGRYFFSVTAFVNEVVQGTHPWSPTAD